MEAGFLAGAGHSAYGKLSRIVYTQCFLFYTTLPATKCLKTILMARKAATSVKYHLIDQNQQLARLLSAMRGADLIGMDTEFVAEDCYRPDLCLLQIATRDEVFLVDPLSITQLDEVWQHLLDPKHQVVVHAGREEVLFAYRAMGRPIDRLFDVQLAVGMLGGEYPSSYGKLLQRVLGQNASKEETRTDWRRRPLTDSQMEYAALDVLHLPALHDALRSQLDSLGRIQWIENELRQRQINLISYEQAESWTRLPGIQTLSGRQLAIVREVWLWREKRAQHKNMPARRVLRDDLIIELARRGSADPKKISHVRGLHHSGLQRFVPELAECVSRGQGGDIPALPWAAQQKRPRPPVLLQQFLTAAMSYLCRSNQISPAIVGTTDDVGRLASYWMSGQKLPESDEQFPNLLRGWRAEMVGKPLYEIFAGRRTLWVQHPQDEMPLALCDVPNEPSPNGPH